MLVTIWMWTHEWSVRPRRWALTPAMCHHALTCRSPLTASSSWSRRRLPRVGARMWMSASGASAGATSRRLVKRQARPGDLDDHGRAVPRHAQRDRRAGGQVDFRPIARARHRGGEHLRAEAAQGDARVVAAGERGGGRQLAATAIEDAHVGGSEPQRARGAVDEGAEEHLAALDRTGARPALPADARRGGAA